MIKHVAVASVVALTLTLTACGGEKSAPQQSDVSSPPTAASLPVAKTLKETFQEAGTCDSSFALQTSSVTANNGEICLYGESIGDGGYDYDHYVAFGELDNSDKAVEFAQSAMVQLASRRDYMTPALRNDWLYSYDNGWIVSAEDDILSQFAEGRNVVILDADDDIEDPKLNDKVDEIADIAGELHGRCDGSSMNDGNLYEEPQMTSNFDLCYTAGRLTEITAFGSWATMSPHLNGLADTLQAPDKGPYFGLVGDYWVVADNYADKDFFE